MFKHNRVLCAITVDFCFLLAFTIYCYYFYFYFYFFYASCPLKVSPLSCHTVSQCVHAKIAILHNNPAKGNFLCVQTVSHVLLCKKRKKENAISASGACPRPAGVQGTVIWDGGGVSEDPRG